MTTALLLLLAGCATFSGRRGPAPLHPQSPAGTWHVVAPGETMAVIAARAGVPLDDLLEINGLQAEEHLAPGRTIFVLAPPGATATSDPTPSLVLGTGSLLWPLAQPVVSSVFGPRDGRPHEGIDLAAPTGTPVYAADAGFVLYAGDAVRGYGNMVVVQHGDDLLTVYAHNSVVLVRTGDRIESGQEIAKVGQSGRATAPHLHFEVRKGQVPQDPMRFLPPPDVTAARVR